MPDMEKKRLRHSSSTLTYRRDGDQWFLDSVSGDRKDTMELCFGKEYSYKFGSSEAKVGLLVRFPCYNVNNNSKIDNQEVVSCRVVVVVVASRTHNTHVARFKLLNWTQKPVSSKFTCPQYSTDFRAR